MLRCSRICAAALAASVPRLQFAGAGSGGGGGGRHSSRQGSGARAGAMGSSSGPAEVDDTVEGLFGAFKRRFAEFELSRDRRLDDEARAEAAEREQVGERMGMGMGMGGGGDVDASGRPLRISENARACPRSVLFSPGSKPRAMEKILGLNADCFILDLEDSVGPAMKREAREHIRAFVDKLEDARRRSDAMDPADAQRLRKRLVVRINSPDCDAANAMLDLELVGQLGSSIEGVAVPKVTTRTYGLIEDYVHPEHQLWAFFETPLSILQAREICLQRVYRYAVMGYNDLANELQLPISATTGDRVVGGADSALAQGLSEAQLAVARQVARLPLIHSTMQVMLAARAAEMHVLDAVYNDPTDAAGFRQELLTCRALGFNGKTLIHPSQIAPTNAAFCPTPAEVAWAARIAQAVSNAKGGVATVDGKMVEDLHVRQASRMLALHRAAEEEQKEQATESK